MISVLPINDINELSVFCKQNSIELLENRGVTIARDGDTVLGYCAYILKNDSITITNLSPEDDIMLADGVLRSALHIADFRNINDAFYQDSVPFNLLLKLGFIEDEHKKTLKIEKLHESCCSCNK